MTNESVISHQETAPCEYLSRGGKETYFSLDFKPDLKKLLTFKLPYLSH